MSGRKRPKGFFITGTDTAVGKTVVSAAVIRYLKSLGYSTGAMKPVETGCSIRDGMLMPSDGMFLKSVSGIDEGINMVTPFVFERPLAPMVASTMEGVEISVDGILSAFEKMQDRYDAVVVEGIGGICVPVIEDYFVSDLARDIGLPLIIVARPSLGTINHTLLTVGHAAGKGLEIAGVVLNYSGPPENSLAEEMNSSALRGILNVPLLGVLPYLSSIDEEALDREFRRHLNLDVLKEALNR